MKTLTVTCNGAGQATGFGDPIILLADRVIESSTGWDYNSDLNALVLTASRLDERHMHEYVRVIRRFRPKFMSAYPSAAEIFASFVQRQGIRDIRLQAVFLESERVYPWQRELVQVAFGGQVLVGYGQSERVIDAVECELRQGYHLNMAYGVMEIVDKDFRPIWQPGVPGRVVGTGLDNYAMPFIRYLLDDVAMWADHDCGCGRRSPLVADFVGRPTEMVVSRSGQRLPLISFYAGTAHRRIRPMIVDIKFVQERAGEVTARLALAPEAPREYIRAEFLRLLRERLDAREFEVDVILVDEIPAQAGGKRGYLDQRLPLDEHGEPVATPEDEEQKSVVA